MAEVDNVFMNVRIYIFNYKNFPDTIQVWQTGKGFPSSLLIEELQQLCAEYVGISAHSFAFFGLFVILENGEKFWLAPNRRLYEEIEAFSSSSRVYFRFRFKPPSSLKLGIPHQYGFTALLQESSLVRDQLWDYLLGQCEYDLIKETLSLMESNQDDELPSYLWALLVKGRSQEDMDRQKWSTDIIKRQLPSFLTQKNRRFVKNVKNDLSDAVKKFEKKVSERKEDDERKKLGLRSVYYTFFHTFMYGNNSRITDKYDVTHINSSLTDLRNGKLFIDTDNPCSCYPSIKVASGERFHEICSLKSLSCYSVNKNELEIHVKGQPITRRFKFSSFRQAISFASELDAQVRTSFDLFANLCIDKPPSVYSPRAQLMKSNFVLPPDSLRDRVPGICISDDIPSSLLLLRPFILQQSNQKVCQFKVVFATDILQHLINCELRIVLTEIGHWQFRVIRGQFAIVRDGDTYNTLQDACQYLLNRLILFDADVTCKEWISTIARDDAPISVRIAHISRSPKVHYIDPEAIEDMKLKDGNLGLPVLVSRKDIVPHDLHIADGDFSRLRFAWWSVCGLHCISREINGIHNWNLRSRFWESAELWSSISHPCLVRIMGFSPCSDFYLLEFSQGPLDTYFKTCQSALYFTHLLMAAEKLAQSLHYLSVIDFKHGDIRLANVALWKHAVEPKMDFDVKLMPPELSHKNHEEAVVSVMLSSAHRAVFLPPHNNLHPDIYAFGVSMIQLLRLGGVPPRSDIEYVQSFMPNESNLDRFLKIFPYSRDEYADLLKKVLEQLKRCLNFSIGQEETPEFLLSVAKEIKVMILSSRNLHPVPLNLSIAEPEIPNSIPFCKIFYDSEEAEINSVMENGEFMKFIELNSGHFGEVRKGFWREEKMDGTMTVKTVALKRLLSRSSEDPERMLHRIAPEYVIWCNLRHQNIVEVFGLTWAEERPCIVMEFVGNGLTLKKLKEDRVIRDDTFFKDMLLILIQVASGMKYLVDRHRPIIHGDLAARNILIREEESGYLAKIGDFGLASEFDPSATYEYLVASVPRPQPWCPPEVVQGCRFTLTSDVYSFGVLSWEVLCQGDPWKSENHFTWKSDVPEQLRILLKTCWKMSEQRPGFQTLHQKLLLIFNDLYR